MTAGPIRPFRPLRRGWLFGMALVGICAWADKDRLPVEDPRALMVAAIDAPDGQARGTLVGERADAIRERFQAKGPIQIEVTTEHRFSQAGCSRLRVKFWQEEVLLTGGPGARTQTIDFGINYCRDGRPPVR